MGRRRFLPHGVRRRGRRRTSAAQMIDSRSGGECCQAAGWSAEVVIEPDARCQREECGGDPGSEAVRGCGR